MKSFSIYEAKAKLSELLRTIKRGGEVIITDRGKPVAKVVPYTEEYDIEKILKRLKQSGHLVEAKTAVKFPAGVKIRGALNRFLEERE